jgi:hypothetical protein
MQMTIQVKKVLEIKMMTMMMPDSQQIVAGEVPWAGVDHLNDAWLAGTNDLPAHAMPVPVEAWKDDES